MGKDIVQYSVIESIVNGYEEVQADVTRAFDLLEKAKARLGEVLLKDSPYLWEGQISCYGLPDSAKESKAYIKRNVWQYLVNKSGIKDYMSIKEREKFEAQIYDSKKETELPELTINNVLATFNGFTKNAGRMRTNAAKEVFNWLRPSKFNTYKTNKKYKIGKKAIIDRVFGLSWPGCPQLNYSYEQEVKALENIFTLLDGKGIRHYPDDILTKIKTACDNKQTHFENEYFALKWFKKGTLHITFKRQDLLDQLNLIGNDASLGNEY
jgi:hypothetical protein